MQRTTKQFYGITLIELVVSLAVIALLVTISVPATQYIRSSMESTGAKSMISAALASARAIAAKEQRYAGVRFQHDRSGRQYIIFILHDPEKLTANGFRAIEGLKPLKLPEAIGVMDLTIVRRTDVGTQVEITDFHVDNNQMIDEPNELTDAGTFSIVFSPSGKLVVCEVRVRNKHGYTPSNDSSSDIVFNTINNVFDVNNQTGMFLQDDYFYLGLGPERSRRSFVIYERKQFDQINRYWRWDNYLSKLQLNYINPYTGTIISNE